MSIPRKGSRTVSQGEHLYRWHVRRCPTYTQAAFRTPMTVAIERVADAPGTVLLVNLSVSRPDNWGNPHQTALKPATIRAIIAEALCAAAPAGDRSHRAAPILGPTRSFSTAAERRARHEPPKKS